MKKHILSALAVCAALLGCQKGEISEPLSSGDDLHAIIEDEPVARTVMDDNNNIRWSENDQIIAFLKTSLGLKYQVAEESVGKTSARFVKKANGGSDDLYGGTEWDHNVVYYPYSETVEAAKSGSGYALDIILPSEQAYAPESFANGAMAMVAVSEDNNITFKNVLGGIKLQLKGTQTVKSINLQGKNNEKLSGAATVTAYTDETKPAITMSQTASTSVTLNCGSGVQLNESTATEFIISLPPILFSKGFTLTVTDDDSHTYVVSTDKANAVLRSSLLTMPAFKLADGPEPSNTENAVDMIDFNYNSLTIIPNVKYTLSVDFEPYTATDKTLVWNSSNPSVASVDPSGMIASLSEGSTTITAVAVGGATATCNVTVKSCVAATIDYEVDGINYGKGISIGDVVWAPVNCGYEAPTSTYKGYPYGKLFQWGRPYGQGHSSRDATYPTGDNYVIGPVMPSVGLAEENRDKYYTHRSSPYDWSKVQKDDLWNSGTEAEPVKTVNDPCPDGWRVPTSSELGTLRENYKGLQFYGEYTALEINPTIEMVYKGYISYDGTVLSDGGFWSSTPNGRQSCYLQFKWSPRTVQKDGLRVSAFYIRCVQE